MSNLDVIRAWKDEEYRLSLSEAERALLPEHPAGMVELKGTELDSAVGGIITVQCSFNCPTLLVGPCLCTRRTYRIFCCD